DQLRGLRLADEPAALLVLDDLRRLHLRRSLRVVARGAGAHHAPAREVGPLQAGLDGRAPARYRQADLRLHRLLVLHRLLAVHAHLVREPARGDDLLPQPLVRRVVVYGVAAARLHALRVPVPLPHVAPPEAPHGRAGGGRGRRPLLPLGRHVLAGHAHPRHRVAAPDLDRRRPAARPGRHLRRGRGAAGGGHEPLPAQGPAACRDHTAGELLMAEYDREHNSRLLAMVIGTVAALVVVVLGIAQFFDIAVRDEIQEKVLSQPSSALRDLHASEQSRLQTYAWVDQKAGVVRIPVDRAIELTLRDWDKRPTGLVKVDEGAPPPAP